MELFLEFNWTTECVQALAKKFLAPKMVDEHVKLCTSQFPCDENLIEPH